MENLLEGLNREIARVKEILPLYEAIPAGVFGAGMIKVILKLAETAITNGDTVDMIRCYKALEEIN